ncbi:hypothetical protein [Rhodococcus sp. IEGM 1379]|uniref:hypothetical protein n=1 Tax=Rhodococcus sp. IEGM 1379 TaxID=3047086 RepID=UPI0024B68C2E|nr:hypothetical protein [Rhodococcus sp. IEGM 1379]MDI9918484.1 hypothetical protein [Rhodococcus sp. IEGM 1379]
MMNSEPGKHVSEESQSARGAPGSRDTGSDEPGGGPVDRPSGSFDDEETISGSKSGEITTPADSTAAEPAVPPYEGRKKSANDSAFQDADTSEGPNTGGAVQPVVDSELKAPPTERPPRGSGASPADEQPAADAPGSGSADRGVGPAHQTGVARGEDQPPESTPLDLSP